MCGFIVKKKGRICDDDNLRGGREESSLMDVELESLVKTRSVRFDQFTDSQPKADS